MIRRIFGLLVQEWYISKRSLEVIMDTIWYSTLSVVVFGFVAKYISSQNQPGIGEMLLSGMIWWEFLRINQYSLTLNPMWNIWSRNFCNMFISPLSKTEYLVAQFIVGFLKSSIVFIINLLVVRLVFNTTFLQNYSVLTFIGFISILALFAWSMGLVIMGIIFLYGTRIQALAWGFIAVVQPLVAVFFPVSVMPLWLQTISYLFPVTYLFEINRLLIVGFTYPASYMAIAALLSVLYFIISLYIFKHFFAASQLSGQFAKNDEG